MSVIGQFCKVLFLTFVCWSEYILFYVQCYETLC